MKKNCVFCDRTQFEERLIAETNGWYVIATLGQITNGGYVLLVPKMHITCIGELNRDETGAMVRIGKKILRALAVEYRQASPDPPYPVTVFEHGIVGQTISHAHLHFLPVELDMYAKVDMQFLQAKMEKVANAESFRQAFRQRNQPYLFWTSRADHAWVCWDPADVPPQFLRKVAAELIGRPERTDWKAMDPELDRRLWQETVARLKPYFT